MTDLRRRLRSVKVPDREEFGARLLARWMARFLFVAAFLFAVALSISADMVFVAIGASVLVAQMLFVVLPMTRIRARVRRYWTGEAGEDVVDELEARR